MYLNRTILDNLMERLCSFNLISALLLFLVFSFMITSTFRQCDETVMN